VPNEDPDGDGNLVRFDLRFPGQVLDRETGLHYNYFRDYDPAMKNCQCFWQSVGAVPPSGLPAGAIPIEPFAN